MQTKALRTLLIGSDEALIQDLRQAVLQVCPLLTTRMAGLDLGKSEIRALVSLEHPPVVFLETEDLERSMQIASEIHRLDRDIQVVAFSRSIGNEGLLSLMRAGVREWLQAPVAPEPLRYTLERIQSELEDHPPTSSRIGELVSFIPSKPGSGASTLAMHVAHGCAKACGGRVALIDLDMNCGAQGFMTKAVGGLSVWEASQHAHRMDESLWEQLVARKHQVDLLQSGPQGPSVRIEASHLQTILGYAVGRYPVVVADLSGNLEKYAIHTMEQSGKIFLVCATDLASLYLARRKMEFFKEIGMLDRVHVVVNRASFSLGLGTKAMEEILATKPAAHVPNAFIPLQKALRDGAVLGEATPFGESILALVAMVVKNPQPNRMDRQRDWIRGALFSNTLQALKSAVQSFRPNGSVLQDTQDWQSGAALEDLLVQPTDSSVEEDAEPSAAVQAEGEAAVILGQNPEDSAGQMSQAGKRRGRNRSGREPNERR